MLQEVKSLVNNWFKSYGHSTEINAAGVTWNSLHNAFEM